MKKLLKWAAILMGALLFIAVVGGVIRGGEWEVSRDIVIDAAPEDVQRHVEDLRKWGEWNPFEKELRKTNHFEITYGDEIEGVVKSYEWVSEDGPGEIEILESSPRRVTFEVRMEGFAPVHGKLEFKAHEASTRVPFRTKVASADVQTGTRVIWTDTGDIGENPFRAWFALTMDEMMGGYFESGLADLKEVVERDIGAADD